MLVGNRSPAHEGDESVDPPSRVVLDALMELSTAHTILLMDRTAFVTGSSPTRACKPEMAIWMYSRLCGCLAGWRRLS